MPELNEILITCAKLRGCYPLMHRTLHEFGWFVDLVIFGWTSYRQYEMDEAIREHGGLTPNLFKIWDEERKKEQEIHEKWSGVYDYGDNELLSMAIAFQEYCIEEYGQSYCDNLREIDDLIKKLKDDL